MRKSDGFKTDLRLELNTDSSLCHKHFIFLIDWRKISFYKARVTPPSPRFCAVLFWNFMSEPSSARKKAVLVMPVQVPRHQKHGLLGLPCHHGSSWDEKLAHLEGVAQRQRPQQMKTGFQVGPGSHWVSLLLLPGLKIQVGSKVSRGVHWPPDLKPALVDMGLGMGQAIFSSLDILVAEAVTHCTPVVWHALWLSSHHVGDAYLIERSVMWLGSILSLPGHSLQTLVSSDTVWRLMGMLLRTIYGYLGDGVYVQSFLWLYDIFLLFSLLI